MPRLHLKAICTISVFKKTYSSLGFYAYIDIV